MGYEEDNIATIYKELFTVEQAVVQCGQNIKKYAIEEARIHSEYELAKSDFKGKRTEAQRRAIYRTDYAIEREQWIAAKSNLDSERDLLRALTAQLNSVQTRSRLLKIEDDMNSYKT